MQNYSSRFQNREAAYHYESLYTKKGTFDALIWAIELEALHSLLLTYAEPTHEKNYLDFACGTGRIISALEHLFEQSYGVDISPHMVEIAKTKVTNAKILVGNLIEDPDLLRGPFDIITCFRFFLNADEILRQRALLALKQRMHKNSLLFLNNHGSSPSLRSITIRMKKNSGKDINEIRRKHFEHLIRLLGFRIIDRIGLAVLTPRLSKILGGQFSSFLETVFYRSSISKFIGSNQIYVLKSDQNE
ncbi:class I SAM-dependent methyltransferase [Thermanaerothrix sp.]|uniref:class I SAM-dependent methyltransferase n=1 Tax=Thermanaerothrix sp. TaxID=2972675 RepID=UPI002ADDF20A|nr:class I SAM-dependent methyltransferase [Thermanaerothrix sp.]